jgi:hypothetical protein
MPRWMPRCGRRALVVMFVGCLLVVGLQTTAQASGLHSNTDPYTVSGARYIADLQACVRYSVSGTVTYTSERVRNPAGPGYFYRIRKITFVAPKTSATMYRYDPGNHSCTTRKLTVSKLRVSQAISGYACSFNPQVSVGFPFAVGVGFWPSCGDRRAARYSGSVARNSTIKQSNQDSRIRFGDQVRSSARPQCYGAAINFKVTSGSTVATAASGRMRVCLTPRY